MILENKLNITNQVELARAEERISKQKAKQLYDSGDISQAQVGTMPEDLPTVESVKKLEAKARKAIKKPKS